jgi:hypothetical protein
MSEFSEYDNSELRYKLTREHANWVKDIEQGAPDVENPFWSFGGYELVGHRKQTNENCGKFKHFSGCLNVELHNAVRWFFPDLKKDSVFVKPVYWSCDKPTCPVCYKYGWATREAVRMEKRLNEASSRFGLVEHVVVSVPSKEYGLSLEALRKKAVKIMYNRGVIGGSMIFHGFRYRNRRVARKTGVACWLVLEPSFSRFRLCWW